MLFSHLWYLVLAFYSIKFANSDQECEFSNIDLKAVVEGIPGKVKSLKSMHVVTSGVQKLPQLVYELTNMTLTGMENCKVIKIHCEKTNKNKLTFEYNIECSSLHLELQYEADGVYDQLLIEGHGEAKHDFVDYIIMFSGTYEVVIGQDQVNRPIIKSYTLDTDPRAPMITVIRNTYHGDKNKDALANKVMNDHWRTLEKVHKKQTISRLMDHFIQNINDYSKVN